MKHNEEGPGLPRVEVHEGDRDTDRNGTIWTTANAVTAIRILGSPPLLWAAFQGRATVFLALVAFLLFTDWLDGRLAAVLGQRTPLGARLDSWADALLYGCIGLSLWWLEQDLILEHWLWMTAAIGTWILSQCVALVRFGKPSTYHMWSAKLAWFVAACALILILLTDSTFLFPTALALTAASNLHAVTISLTLPEWRPDVWSVREALRVRAGTREPSGQA